MASDYKVVIKQMPPKVKIVMAKGEKGEPGEKGEKGDAGGVASYAEIPDKPSINDVTLEGDQSLEDLDVYALSNSEIEDMLNND